MIMLHFKSLHVFFHILIPLIIKTVRLCGEHFLTHYILKSYIKIIKKKNNRSCERSNNLFQDTRLNLYI